MWPLDSQCLEDLLANCELLGFLSLRIVFFICKVWLAAHTCRHCGGLTDGTGVAFGFALDLVLESIFPRTEDVSGNGQSPFTSGKDVAILLLLDWQKNLSILTWEAMQ